MSRSSSIYAASAGTRSRQRLTRQLRELMAASVAITSARSVPEILQTIAEQARRLTGAEQALIEVRPHASESLRAFSASKPHIFDLERDGGALSSLAHESTRPLRLNPQQIKSYAKLRRQPAGLCGWMAARLCGRDGQAFGNIQLANKEHGQFNEHDEFVLAQLAQFAAVAVENARLYSESQRQLAERVRAEDTLRLYRQIFASSNDAIAVVDANGVYLEQNEAHRKLVGYSDKELDGATPSIHLGEAAFAEIAGELARTGQYRGELTSRTRSGELINIDLSAFTMRDVAGEVRCHVGIKRDISERKRVEDEIRARVRQQAAVAELGRRALAGAELGALMDDAAQLVAKTLEVELCKVLELLPDEQELLLRAGVGWKPGYVGKKRIDAGLGSHAGFTLVSSEPVIIKDLRTETRFNEPLLQEHSVISGISVIIEGGARPFGVLGAHSTSERAFTHDDVNFLQAIANVLAIALQRSRADEALRQNEALLSLAQSAADLATWEWNLVTGEISWSAGSAELYGMPNTQITRFEQWPEFLHPEDRDWVLGSITKAIQGGAPNYDAEFRIIRSDDAIRWIAARGQVFRDGSGRPVRMIGINMDVSARKQAEDALRQSEERFRRAQKSANIGAYDWDVRTGHVHWSEELGIIKDLAPDGKFDTWMQHIVGDDRPRVQQAINDALAKRGDFDIEMRMTTSRGIVWLGSRGQVFTENGAPAHVLGVVMDITARKRAEELLRRSEKLAVVGRLAATIAHEINNPLESVTNLLYLLEHHVVLDETARGYARLAQQELHRVAHIARQTLSFHRESAIAVPVKLADLLDNVLQMHARRIEALGIQVETRYDFADAINVFPSEIQQVVSNLVLNAVEALGSNGRLLVRLSPAAERHQDRRRRGVRLVVADNGPGIPPEYRQQIFEPFFTTKGEKGTGLGLWVINGIVQKHNGSIRMRSNVTPGRSFTCFSVFLPSEGADAVSKHAKKEAAAQPSSNAA